MVNKTSSETGVDDCRHQAMFRDLIFPLILFFASVCECECCSFVLVLLHL